MKILQNIQRIFSIIGYLPDPRDHWQRIIVPIMVLITLISMEVSAAVYAVRHIQSGDIENSLYAGLDVPGTLLMIGTYLTIMYHKEKVRQVIDDFQKIFDECNDAFKH